MMYYTIRHVTKFRYSDQISESVMEVRMQPRTEGRQRCLSFELRTNPKSLIGGFADNMHNRVHHFDVPDRHTHLNITAQSLVEISTPADDVDETSTEAWPEMDLMTASDEHWDMLQPTPHTSSNDALDVLAREIGLARGTDPFRDVLTLNTAIHNAIQYDGESTDVNSPIDDALASRQGVCQDFAHVMIALTRRLGIPCRYVSGYLYHRRGEDDQSPADATHAWVEALLPRVGWTGFDPTNNIVAGDRHIRVAVGRDYTDVPPTRGVFRGRAEAELAVSVRVIPSPGPTLTDIGDEEREPIYRRTLESNELPDQTIHEQPQQ